MITLAQAQAQVRNRAGSFGTEFVGLEQSLGRILAGSVLSDRDYPPFRRSMMDGYALRSADFVQGRPGSEIELPLVGTLHAGEQFTADVPRGSCLRIMTGAAVPDQLDAVVRQEDARAPAKLQPGARIAFERVDVPPGLNIAGRGEDVRAGAELLGAGTRVDVPTLALLATVGQAQVAVHKCPLASIVVTGDEIVGVDQTPGPVQIRASNAYAIQAFLAAQQIEASIHFARDRPGELRSVLEQALESDLVVISGGVSVGDRDLVPAMLKQLGMDAIFHGVQVKPGKPVLFGQRGPTIVFGLPGNPFAVQVLLRVLVLEWLYACWSVRPEVGPLVLPLGEGRARRGERAEFFAARLENRGASVVVPIRHNGSGDVTAGVGAGGIALVPAGKERLEAGDLVEFYPWQI